MVDPSAPSRFEAVLAYSLSGLTSLLWVACVIPAGSLLAPSLASEWATPLFRERVLLIPGLFLLIVLPASFTLARRTTGLTALLAGTDAFVAIYAGLALVFRYRPDDATGILCVALLFLLGALSGLEVWRALTNGQHGQTPGEALPRHAAGARLALCLLILIVPARFLLETGAERASWLAPFVFVTISAAGARLASSDRALRLLGALLQLAVAVHVMVALRYTLFHSAPLFFELEISGRVTLGLVGAVAFVAVLQSASLVYRVRAARRPQPMPV